MENNEYSTMTFDRPYIVDCQSLVDFCELRKDLITEIERDTIENRNDEGIVKSNIKLLEKVWDISTGYSENFIIEELEKYGAYILKLKDIVNTLIDLQNYYKNNDITNGNNEMVKNIDNVLWDIKNYFTD